MSGESQRPEHDDVRRLLAQARHDEPMPEDVAARMAGVLAGLAGAEPPRRATTVVPIASRHRRRKAAGLLVAAAAIVVGGVGVSQLHLSSNQSSATASSSATEHLGNSGDSASAGRNSAQGATPKATRSSVPLPVPQLSAQKLRVRHGRLVVRPGHFSADVRAAQRILVTDSLSAASRDFGAAGCVIAAPVRSTVVAASYERAPAALVYRRPEGSTRVVDLYLCGHTTPARSVTLPLP